MNNDEYYRILGIGKDAEPDEIKRAYHQKAKSAHPDKGGDAEEFTRLQIAYRCLSDEESKASYDATGEAKAKVDIENAALNHVINILKGTIDQADKVKVDPLTLDLVQMVRDGLVGSRAKVEEKVLRHENQASKLVQIAKRLKPKTGKKSSMRALLRYQANIEKQQGKAGRRVMATFDRAIKIVDDHEFDMMEHMEQTATTNWPSGIRFFR